MRLRILTILLLVSLLCGASEPWKLRLRNEKEGILLHINLYAEDIEVPGMEMFGAMNGYLGGKGVYGVWALTSFDIKDDKTAILRVSNDLGSETQSIRLSQQTDSTYLMELQNGVVVKKAVNRKLVKIPAELVLSRIAD